MNGYLYDSFFCGRNGRMRRNRIGQNIMTSICEKHGITSAGRGICFSLPVESVAGLHVSADLKKKED